MSLTFKRHYPLLGLFVALVLFLTLALGRQRIVAYTAPGRLRATGPIAALLYPVPLFDESRVHSIQILISPEDYAKMLATYQTTGAKDYFHADVLIDGARVNNVGIRLKGNASLRTALGRLGRPLPDGLRFRNEVAGSSGAARFPLMIKFDEFVKGQAYQGYARLAIRTYGTSYDAALLQEPVTNHIFRLMGLPAPRTAFTGVRLNDQAEQLYTIAEIIDESYLAQHFANPGGVLYKAELGSNLTYRGQDPSAYARSFTQQTRVNEADLGPLIAFLRFLAESDDAAFERELPAYLDVEALAAYLAINNLLVNIDSIGGMNNNYYLYYDDAARRFTLLMWDANESLGKLGGSQGTNFDLYYQGRVMRGPGGGENTLVKRFLANAAFKSLYERKLRQVYQRAFVEGALTRQVNVYAALVGRANLQRNLGAPEGYAAAVARTLSFITQRGDYLASTPLLGKQSSSSP